MTTPLRENDPHKVIYTRTGGDPITPDSIEQSKQTGLKFFAVFFGGSAVAAGFFGLGGLAAAALAVGCVASLGLIFSARKAQHSGKHRAITASGTDSTANADTLRRSIEQAGLPAAIASDLTNSLNELIERANSLAEAKTTTEEALSRIPVADTERKLQEAIDKADPSGASIHVKTLSQAEALENEIERINAGLMTVQNGMLALQSAVRTASLPTPIDTDVDISEIELQARALTRTSEDLHNEANTNEPSAEASLAAAADMLAKRQGK
jgi:hypothetical protein